MITSTQNGLRICLIMESADALPKSNSFLKLTLLLIRFFHLLLVLIHLLIHVVFMLLIKACRLIILRPPSEFCLVTTVCSILAGQEYGDG